MSLSIPHARCNIPCFAIVRWHFTLSWTHLRHQPLLPAGRILVLFMTSLPYPNLFHLRYNGQEYDVSWTMPQCVLCLRLIGQLFMQSSTQLSSVTKSSFNVRLSKSCLGLSWDVYDGERQRMKPTSLSPDQVLADWRIKQKATQYFFRRNQHLPALQTFLSSSLTPFLLAAISLGPSSP